MIAQMPRVTQAPLAVPAAPAADVVVCCARCKRPLKNVKARAAGIGATCAKKQAAGIAFTGRLPKVQLPAGEPAPLPIDFLERVRAKEEAKALQVLDQYAAAGHAPDHLA